MFCNLSKLLYPRLSFVHKFDSPGMHACLSSSCVTGKHTRKVPIAEKINAEKTPSLFCLCLQTLSLYPAALRRDTNLLMEIVSLTLQLQALGLHITNLFVSCMKIPSE